MSGQNSASAPTRRFAHLDALRGVAIVGVFAAHAVDMSELNGHFAQLGLAGVRGVQLFYMVSAFTLLLSLEKRTSEHHQLSNFFLRRFFRIAPLFYLSLLGSWLCPAQYSAVTPQPTNWEYALGLFFLFGFKASAINSIVIGGWSVAVETTFYAILPALHSALASLKRSAWAYLVSTVCMTCLSFAMTKYHPLLRNFFTTYWFPIELPVFLLGMVIYFYWKCHLSGGQMRLCCRRIASLVSLVVGALVFCISHLLSMSSAMSHVPIDTIAVGLLLLSVVMHPWTFLVNPVSRFLGKISYSLYLLHFWVMFGLVQLDKRLHGSTTGSVFGLPMGHTSTCVVLFVLLALISVPLSMISWRFIEEPFIGLGRTLIARHELRSHKSNIKAHVPLTSPVDTADAQF